MVSPSSASRDTSSSLSTNHSSCTTPDTSSPYASLSPASASTVTFLSLPGELRSEIYHLALLHSNPVFNFSLDDRHSVFVTAPPKDSSELSDSKYGHWGTSASTGLFLTNHQISQESLALFYSMFEFVFEANAAHDVVSNITWFLDRVNPESLRRIRYVRLAIESYLDTVFNVLELEGQLKGELTQIANTLSAGPLITHSHFTHMVWLADEVEDNDDDDDDDVLLPMIMCERVVGNRKNRQMGQLWRLTLAMPALSHVCATLFFSRRVLSHISFVSTGANLAKSDHQRWMSIISELSTDMLLPFKRVSRLEVVDACDSSLSERDRKLHVTIVEGMRANISRWKEKEEEVGRAQRGKPNSV